MTMDQMLKDEELIREKIMVPQFVPDEVIPEDAAKEIEKECIYLPPFYFAEVGVANKLKKLAAEPAADRLWVSLMKARQDTGNPELSVDVEENPEYCKYEIMMRCRWKPSAGQRLQRSCCLPVVRVQEKPPQPRVSLQPIAPLD